VISDEEDRPIVWESIEADEDGVGQPAPGRDESAQQFHGLAIRGHRL
jgi:hypothetical protein